MPSFGFKLDFLEPNPNSGWETGSAPSKVAGSLTKKAEKPSTQCDVFMRMEEVDAADHTFPFDIPDELRTYFSLNGTIEFGRYGALSRTSIWTRALSHGAKN
jgi:hypothetical protein